MAFRLKIGPRATLKARVIPSLAVRTGAVGAIISGAETQAEAQAAIGLANSAVTNEKLADMAQATIKLRPVGVGTGAPVDGTPEQARAVIGITARDFDTVASVGAASIEAAANVIRTNGYSAAGDGGAALHKRTASEPSHAGKIQSDDGAWWEQADEKLREVPTVFRYMAPGLQTKVCLHTAGDGDAPAITAAVQTAIDAHFAVFFPAGIYKLDARLTSAGPRVLYGASMFASRVQWIASAATSGIEIESGADWRTSEVRSLALETYGVASGTALRFDYTGLISGGTIVPRAMNSAKVHHVMIRGATSYTTDGWLNGVEFESCLSCTVESVRFNGVYTGAYGSIPDSNKAIAFFGSGLPTSLVLSDSWLSAWGVGLYTANAEGIYVTNSELVTVGIGCQIENVASEPLFNLGNSHIAAITKCVELTYSAEFSIVGNDLYPIGPQTGDFIGVHVLGGCAGGIIASNNFNRPNVTSLYRGVVEDGGTYTLIDGNVFNVGGSSGCVGIDITVNASNTHVSATNVFKSSLVQVRDASSSAMFGCFRAYSGDVDSITTSSNMLEQTHLLSSTATNAPSGLGSTTGCVLKTYSYDANTAVQVLLSPAQGRQYLRRKAAGAWTAWTYVDLTDALIALSSVTGAADKLPYFTGTNTAGVTDFTTFARSLMSSADAAAAQSTLSLGTMATQGAGAVAVTGGAIDGTTIGGTAPAVGTFTTATAGAFIPSGSAVPANGLYLPTANVLGFSANSTSRWQITSGGSFVGQTASTSAQLASIGATGTAPTLIPNKASSTSGIGSQATGNISLIASGAEVQRITSTRTVAILPVQLPSYTVASLPTGAAGDIVFCSNCRVFNGAGTQEGAGVGTGGVVTHNGTAWKIAGTNINAVA